MQLKKTISLAFYEHLLRVRHLERQFKKDNVLLVGPSGSGKTELLRVLRQISPVCISFFDASGMSSDGWKGNKKVSSTIDTAIMTIKTMYSENLPIDIIEDLIQKSIIFIDEFDKALRPSFSSGGDNVSLHIQGEMLKLFEDGNFITKGYLFTGSDGTPDVIISTKDILFICAGAFSEIEAEQTIKNIGFIDYKNQVVEIKRYHQDDLIKFGMTPELAGRIPIIETLYKLVVDDLVTIITNISYSPISEFINSLEREFEYRIQFSTIAYYDIVMQVIGKTGARGIRAILSNLKKEIVYHVPFGSNVRITGHNKYLVLENKNEFEH